MSAQDRVLEPVRTTEGILSLWMNQGTFYVAGGSCAKYSFEHPWGTFGEWWERKEQKYEAGREREGQVLLGRIYV